MENIVPALHRDVGVYTALIRESVIKAINEDYLAESFDFAISTGDHTDTAIRDELELGSFGILLGSCRTMVTSWNNTNQTKNTAFKLS